MSRIVIHNYFVQDVEPKLGKFHRNSGSTYKCRACGKATRETGNNESLYNLCRGCLEKAELEEK